MGERRILLLTGAPGVGKTTLVRTVAERLEGARIGGFYTEEVREAGRRRGFRLVTFGGEAAIIADAGLRSPVRVGRYGVDVAAVDRLCERALSVDDAVLYLVDEIGAMECASRRFTGAMRALLASDKPILATVARRGGGLIAEVKRHRDAELRVLTRERRDALVEPVLAWARAHT